MYARFPLFPPSVCDLHCVLHAMPVNVSHAVFIQTAGLGHALLLLIVVLVTRWEVGKVSLALPLID